MSKLPPVRAFSVLEDTENTGGIVFARHAIVARREGAAQFNGGEFEGLIVRRAPWADTFADNGHVPASVCVAHGWRFECHGCGRTINTDNLYDLGLAAEGVVGDGDSAVFCTAGCEERERIIQRRRRRHARAAIRLLRGIVRRRFGKVTFITGRFRESAYVDRTLMAATQASVSFTFPGQVYGPASLRYDGPPYSFIGPTCPEFRCSAGDLSAFRAAFGLMRDG